MNHDVTPEEKTCIGAGPPKKYTIPPPKDSARCIGCPYPSVGFICWSTDGCMKTDAEKISRQRVIGDFQIFIKQSECQRALISGKWIDICDLY